MMFVITIDVGAANSSVALGTLGWSVIFGVVFVALAVAVLFAVRAWRLSKRRDTGGEIADTVLRIRLPRFATDAEGKGGVELRQVQEDIAVAETFFTSIGGKTPQHGFKVWWNGRTDRASFETVAKDGVISFYAVMPPQLVDQTIQQLNAQFPAAEIERAADYNLFAPSGVVLGSYLSLKRESLFPIKTYRELESDPLNALLNALAKVAKTDGAAIQFTIRSSKPKWREKSFQVVENLHKGATLNEALKGKRFKPGKKKGGLFGELVLQNPSNAQDVPEPQRQMTQREQEMAKNIEDKGSKAGMDVNIRVIASAANIGVTQGILNNVLNSFSQYNIYEYGNAFEVTAPKNPKKIVHDFIHRNFVEAHGFVLNTQEMASLWHPPLPGTETSNIDWLEARAGAAPANVASEGLYLGQNTFRGKETPIYIKEKDRQRHMYFIGKSGSGKTTMLKALALQDIRAGHGVCYVDPHGDAIESLLGNIPMERIDDVIVFSPYDKDMPIGLNMLEAPNEDLRDFAVGEMISIFYKLFPPDMIGPMFEHHMRNVMLTLMADINDPGTIAEIPGMFSDEQVQKKWIARVKDHVVRAYWEQEVAKTSDFHKSETLGYLISKVGRFVEDEMMRNIIGQNKSGFDFRDVMDHQKILFLDLSKGKTGEINSKLLGLIVVTKLQMAAMARADMPEEQRKDFFLYIDEFQNYVTPSIATILSEARKYRLNLIIAHQYMSQVVENGDTQIRDAILGNVGSMFVSRIGPEDTDTFEKIFHPVFTPTDLINSDKFTWYVRMIVDNASVTPFTMCGPSDLKEFPDVASKIRQLSRVRFGRPRAEVAAEILERSRMSIDAPLPAPQGRMV
ncbi:hypothetical protein A3I45_01540 [Candidatus Uhrbacteria bacterium RIFCSPLOWO2_02_FULL_53_10]|uniref:AAA+ ATPase domain-containing protein n=1 Tax=Candidatus Uhrbacteria bacterium RIFCSPLOWO2_02_FULL_53_10 TaxID=1802411 RepID=A0A1F7VEM9_9BACT|nr:MAG: hypothetical protein A3I45_01540 [Candidatus Uhrbacteria bacterium RIFCSPLOWO2_02_FULL_53_10]